MSKLAIRMKTEFSAPENYINRELSWIEFNRRVLEEAQDPTQPLLERVKFMCIVSSNFDEFFEIRVAGIKQQIENGSAEYGADEMLPVQVFQEIQQRVHQIVGDQYHLWHQELVPALAAEGIHFHEVSRLTGADKAWAARYFKEEVFPVLTPLAVDSSHPFPQLLNKSHNLFVPIQSSGQESFSFAIVQIPRVLPRLVKIPREPGKGHHYFLLKELIREYVGELFPGLTVSQSYAFRVTRNSDLYFDDEEAENLLRTIEEGLRRRNRGNAVRLEIQADCPPEIEEKLLQTFNLTKDDLYRVNGPLTFLHLMPLCSDDAFANLKDKPFVPVKARGLVGESDLFEVMRQRDILMHHPYESFNPVVEFVQKAAIDPQVLAIKVTLYRTSGDSPIVRSLIHAAENGKQVTALIELKARFDEANNINWARQLEEAGVHVVYGVVGLKTHCKVLMVVRRDEDKIRHYVHLGTGNYHPSTARFYTDLGLLTTQPKLTQEVATLFNTLTGLSQYKGIKKLMVAPFDLMNRFKELIDHERDLALAGKKGRIIVKLNSLVAEEIIEALYDASRAGVKIDLIVRGICCLRPGIPGVSENIRVISIIGRFLEHSRIYYFGNNGQPKIYLGSADWMPRNFFRRVEVAFPIEDPQLRDRIAEEILPTYLEDCVKARELQPDGTYVRLHPAPGEKPRQAQLTFREIARRQKSEGAAASSKVVLIPQTNPQIKNSGSTPPVLAPN